MQIKGVDKKYNLIARKKKRNVIFTHTNFIGTKLKARRKKN